MLTDAQIAANRKSAANVIRHQLALDTIAPADWSYDQRVQYDQTLAAYILAHQDAFGSQELITAQEVSGNNYGSLEDSSFAFSDFVAEAGANAAAPFQAIGEGVLTAANAAKWAIPLVAGIAVVILLVSLDKRVNA